MPTDHRTSCNLAVAPNVRTSGNSGTGCNCCMRSNAGVMTNLYLVVDLTSTFNYCIVKRTAIDARIGADFDIILDHNATELWNSMPLPLVFDQAETIAADNNSGLKYAAITQADTSP
jgi:hypothetical protein